MTRTPAILIVATVLAVALASCADAVTVPIAPSGQLPENGIHILTGDLGDPAANDAISFYSSPPAVTMVSNFYPLSKDVCDRHAGRRTLSAEPGDYCMMHEYNNYKFTLSTITPSSVEVHLADAGRGNGEPTSTLAGPEKDAEAPQTTTIDEGFADHAMITPTTYLTTFSLSLVITIGCLALAALIVRWLQ